MVSKQNKKVRNMTIGVHYFHSRTLHLLTCFCEQHGPDAYLRTSPLLLSSITALRKSARYIHQISQIWKWRWMDGFIRCREEGEKKRGKLQCVEKTITNGSVKTSIRPILRWWISPATQTESWAIASSSEELPSADVHGANQWSY